jgi:hypothetical protein
MFVTLVMVFSVNAIDIIIPVFQLSLSECTTYATLVINTFRLISIYQFCQFSQCPLRGLLSMLSRSGPIDYLASGQTWAYKLCPFEDLIFLIGLTHHH